MDLEAQLKETLQQQQQMKDALTERLPELLGIPGAEGDVVEVGGKQYRTLQSYDSAPGYMLAVEVTEDPEERTVVEPVVIFVPEIKQLVDDLANDPVSFLRKLGSLADDEGVPEELRNQIGAVNQMLDLMEQGDA